MEIFRKFRRCSALLIALALVVVMSACYATSVYPFYKEGDLTYEPDLLGSWNSVSDNAKTNLIIKPGQKEKEYLIIEIVDGKALVYESHLFEFNKSRYLDVIPNDKPSKDPSKDDANILLTHSLWKVVLVRDKLQFFLLDEKKLEEISDRANARYRKVNENIVLTGTTDEIQDLMGNHMEELFRNSTPALELAREK